MRISETESTFNPESEIRNKKGVSMKMHRLLALVLVLAACAPVPAHASDPVGIYAVVEKVVFEPSESAPERIQIWGAFALTDGRSGDGYLPAQRGYLYFTLTAGKEDVCRKEWNDLKAVAGTTQGVGFGGRYMANGRVRKPGEKAESPDVYPVMMGVTRMGSMHNQPQLIAELRQALK
ncbi:MAG: hypothetical protein DMG10_10295 [Acidobacteria bacterium]|nr:MAG: hypothetical protein DMG10_10295 [Acidobacteriota bacterium]